MQISKVKGTEDFLDLKLHNFALGKIKKHFETHNFSEILLPTIENTSLFARSLGQETDVVSKEMFSFNTASNEEICLRPEATASTMRACIENNIEEFPWKVFTYGPMFRYERPQMGRWREFYQMNVEIIGSQLLANDAQFIAMFDRLFSEIFGLENYVLKLNFLGTREDRAKYKSVLNEYLEKVSSQICNTCKVRKEKNILRVFDCKIEQCKSAYTSAPQLGHNLSHESQKEWEALIDFLTISSINFVHDPFLVRGLDYYNKTVFEFSSNELGAQNSFCGGGRYDNLATEIGSKKDLPSVGAAIGMGRLLMLLGKIENKLTIPDKQTLYLVLPMQETQYSLAMLMAQKLISGGFCTDILFDNPSMKSMMRKANKMGAKYVLILGENEQQSGTVTLKNMLSGESRVVNQNDVLKYC